MEDLDHLPNVECITEEMISLKNELAVVFVVILQEIKTYPVVEMEFHPEAIK
jgi:5-(carboxyamino)imidazole ribonucleotide synthase